MRGKLSEKYETGGRGPGTVSTGVGDPGGVSYGSYQLASRVGRPQEFLQSEGLEWASRFSGLDPTIPDGLFSRAWRRVAAESPSAFFNAQHAFIERTHYSVAVRRLESKTGLDAANLHLAIQDAIWSTAVQMGPATSVVIRAYWSIAGDDRSGPGFERRFINAIYDERSKTDANGGLIYFRSAPRTTQASLLKRFDLERRDALNMMKAK